MSRTITATWTEPKTREGGAPLAKSEIQDTEVLIAATSAGPFTSLSKVKPDQTNTVTKDLADGNYVLRFIVTDTLGQKSKPVDFPIVVKTPLAPPGGVTSIAVTQAA